MNCHRVALAAAIVAGMFAIGCGRKGAPLPPLRPSPGPVTDLTVRRIGDHVLLRFTLPSKNIDNSTPVDLARIDIFARSTPEGSARPVREQIIDRANLVGSVTVRPPDQQTSAPAAGETTTFVDLIPPGTPAPLVPTARQKAEAAAAANNPQPVTPPAPTRTSPVTTTEPRTPPSTTLVPPTTTQPSGPLPPSRYYLLEPVSTHGRHGAQSALMTVALTPSPPAPTAPSVTYDEQNLTLTWQPASADQLFRVYEVDETGKETAARPLNDKPQAPPFSVSVEFGKPRCFSIRAAQVTGPVAIESDAAGPACVTPVDTFPPAAPSNVTLLASTGSMTVVWDAVTAPDLAGYRVLRGEGSDENMRQLSEDLVTTTTLQDSTTKAGVTYVYVVIAVDKAGNKSAESTRVREIGR